MKTLKEKVKGKSRVIMVMLLALVIVVVNTQIYTLAKMTAPKYTSLKYKLTSNITNMKVSKVEYTVKGDNIGFRISYSSKENKNIILVVNNKSSKPIIVNKNGIMKKENKYYEFNIPLLKLKESSSLNLYIVNNTSQAILTGIEAGKKYSDINVTLDSNIINKAKVAVVAAQKDIMSKIQKTNSNVKSNAQSQANNNTSSIQYCDSISKDGLQITKHPEPWNYSQRKLASIPEYDESMHNPFMVDLRSADLSSLIIGKDKLNDLLHSVFDNKTIFPEKLPDGFDPAKIIEIGKNPGLGLTELHKEGITGKGIGIAIIDQNLLVDHVEYKDQLRSYEEIHWPSGVEKASIHGAAVASIAVGKSVEVAPDADLYFIGAWPGDTVNGQFVYDFNIIAKSIDRIIEINNTLPQDKKIRVLSISQGLEQGEVGYKEVSDAVDRAQKQGIFVIYVPSLEQDPKYPFNGLGKGAMSDPDNALSYQLGLFGKYNIANLEYVNKNCILVPMDSRTTASSTGNQDYVYYSVGGLSWAAPYIAGLYALACQVDPAMTPDIFWSAAVKTGTPLIVNKNNYKYNVGNIVNPKKLMETLKK